MAPARRMAKRTDDAGGVLSRYATADSSYYAPLLRIWNANPAGSYYPLFDLTGNAPKLVNGAGTVTDTYPRDEFGRIYGSEPGVTANPYRYGAVARPAVPAAMAVRL